MILLDIVVYLLVEPGIEILVIECVPVVDVVQLRLKSGPLLWERRPRDEVLFLNEVVREL
jgi:hypothetical protein